VKLCAGLVCRRDDRVKIRMFGADLGDSLIDGSLDGRLAFGFLPLPVAPFRCRVHPLFLDVLVRLPFFGFRDVIFELGLGVAGVD
jgi:hypothetical protein